MWWWYILVIATILYPFVSTWLDSDKHQRKLDKLKGCTCKKSFWGAVDFNCPVHNPFYIRHYITSDGRESIDKIYASHGTREPICEKCLNEILPRGYILNWPTEPEEEWCHSCGKMKEIRVMPERDLFLWKK